MNNLPPLQFFINKILFVFLVLFTYWPAVAIVILLVYHWRRKKILKLKKYVIILVAAQLFWLLAIMFVNFVILT